METLAPIPIRRRHTVSGVDSVLSELARHLDGSGTYRLEFHGRDAQRLRSRVAARLAHGPGVTHVTFDDPLYALEVTYVAGLIGDVRHAVTWRQDAGVSVTHSVNGGTMSETPLYPGAAVESARAMGARIAGDDS